jgi:hypothetical protein
VFCAIHSSNRILSIQAKQSMKKSIAVSLAFCFCLFLTGFAWAQPPGPFGPPPGGGFNPGDFLARMDANGNGMIDPDEISDRARGFLIPRLQEAGIDTSKPIPLAKVTEAFERMREQRESGGGDDRDRWRRDEDRRRDEDYAPPTSTASMLPDFSIENEIPLLPDFSLPDDSPLLQSGPLENRYDQRVIERVDNTLRERDRNRNGVLDAEEIRGGRWSPDPFVTDLNKDGRLTRVELAERYKMMFAREDERGGGDDRRRSSESQSDANRGDDRGESRYGRGPSPPGSPYGNSTSSTSSTSSSRSSSSGRSSRSSESDRITSYAKSMLAKYDVNKNGQLEEDEWKSMKGAAEADKDGDKIVSLSELIVKFGGNPDESSSASSSRSAVTQRIGGGNSRATLEDLLEKKGVSSKFIKQDRNADGNLQMAEFAEEWNEKLLDEFDKIDTNRDGVISPSEWVSGGK